MTNDSSESPRHNLTHALLTFISAWVAEPQSTASSEEVSPSHFRRIELRLPQPSGVVARLKLSAAIYNGEPVIEVSTEGVVERDATVLSQEFPDWAAAIEAARHLREELAPIFSDEAVGRDARQAVSLSFGNSIASLPEPIPIEILEFLRFLGPPEDTRVP